MAQFNYGLLSGSAMMSVRTATKATRRHEFVLLGLGNESNACVTDVSSQILKSEREMAIKAAMQTMDWSSR